jgi:hypothetical protein
MQQASLGQPLQNFGERFGRNAKRVSNVFGAGAARALVSVIGQVLHGHQRVIRLFG